MTLDWKQTAHDCRVAQALAPLIDGKAHHHALNWHVMGDDGSWKVTARWKVDDMIREAVRTLPDTQFWKRTKHRASSAHGVYQLRRIMEEACKAGMLEGPRRFPESWPCLCHRYACYYEN
jgi:hypothetical protein